MGIAAAAAWLRTQTREVPLRGALAVLVVLSVAAAAAAAIGRRMIAAVVAMAVITASLGLWVGANSPRLTWFGSQVSHGSRRGNAVALTFDDGPNATATEQIARILDRYDAKGTFFSVGKAVAARPDIVRELAEDGQLIGNHSYTHDSWHWLDPFYGELGQTQHAVKRAAGLCPALYRAPHGQHTPLLARVVHAHGMTMVGWDVSVGDWTVRDPVTIARNVVRLARAGSIIDLHDGLDGRVSVDRTSLVVAMPFILDGLARKHLRVVRVDALIGQPGYLRSC